LTIRKGARLDRATGMRGRPHGRVGERPMASAGRIGTIRNRRRAGRSSLAQALTVGN